MKHVISILFISIGFSLNGLAQTDAKVSDAKQKTTVLKTIDDAATDAHMCTKEVANLLQLDNATVQAFYQLLQMKYTALYDTEINAESKLTVLHEVATKIRATLSAAQMKQLEANAALLSKLIN